MSWIRPLGSSVHTLLTFAIAMIFFQNVLFQIIFRFVDLTIGYMFASFMLLNNLFGQSIMNIAISNYNINTNRNMNDLRRFTFDDLILEWISSAFVSFWIQVFSYGFIDEWYDEWWMARMSKRMRVCWCVYDRRNVCYMCWIMMYVRSNSDACKCMNDMPVFDWLRAIAFEHLHALHCIARETLLVIVNIWRRWQLCAKISWNFIQTVFRFIFCVYWSPPPLFFAKSCFLLLSWTLRACLHLFYVFEQHFWVYRQWL